MIDERAVCEMTIFCIAIDVLARTFPSFSNAKDVEIMLRHANVRNESVMCSKHAFDQNVGHTNKSTFNNDECCICDEGSDEKVVFNHLRLYVRKYTVELAHLLVLYAVCSKF